MNWRGMHVSEPARLSVKQGQMLLERRDGTFTFPLEDMAFLILDTQQVSLTAALMARCAEAGCLVICCNDKHMPCGSLLPFHTFYRHAETLQRQITLSEVRKKRLWQQIIRRKILNQAWSLHRAGRPDEQADRLSVLSAKVKSGDSDNVEGAAARLYWQYWEEHFNRDQDGADRLNVMLNYGYALVRALMARELAGRGFSPSLGLHHRSMANAFNLADDMMEPWRPFVDSLALAVWRKNSEQTAFSLEDRRALANVFFQPVRMDGAEMLLLDAVKKQVEQLRVFYLKLRDDIPLPCFPEDDKRG